MTHRMHALIIAISVIAVLVTVPPAAGSGDVGSKEEPVVRAMNEFALDLYTRLEHEAGGDNVFFSPASISIALSMTAAGARGATAAEMKQALRLDFEDAELHPAVGRITKSLAAEREGSRLSIANALWGQTGFSFLDEFLALAARHYDARITDLDFRNATEEARLTINSWTEEKTNNRIKELLKPGVLTARTRLVLTNAVYFKGTWKLQFDEGETRKEPFQLAAGKSVPVDMMRLRDGSFRYLQEEQLQALEMPYVGEEISMVVLLPAVESDLSSLEGQLTSEKLDTWLGRMSSSNMDLVAIPRFKMTRHYGLSAILGTMGMRKAFGPEADFSGMTTDEDLFISDVVHQAFVEVNEEGTEAAAATGVVGVTVALRSNVFRADRPFLFLIRHRETGLILFMGRVTDPS